MKSLFTALLLLLHTTHTNAQTVSSVGRQFHVSFYGNGFSSAPDVRLYLASKVNTSGTITNPNSGYSIPFSITANSSTVVTLSSIQCVNNAPFTTTNLGLIINSNDSIAVFARNLALGTEDVSMILPVQALSTSYILTNTKASERFLGVFLVQATEDNTVVEIIPSTTLNNNAPSGQPFNITLNRGQTYLGSSAPSADISGTTIRVLDACKPIAVFTGSPAGIVPSNLTVGAEHLYEQVLPDYMLGMEFVTPVLKSRNSSLVRVTAAYDGTTLFRNGTAIAGPLAAKTSFEFETNNTPQYLETNLPVQVALLGHSLQYDTTFGPLNFGDPTLIMLSPICLPVTESYYSAPGNGPYPLLLGVSVICKTTDIGQMRIDGQPVAAAFQPVPGNILYSHALVDTDSGYHYLSNPSGFQAYASAASFFRAGVPNGATSYGFNTSAIIEPITNHFSLNGFSSKDTLTAEVCPGPTTFRVRAPLPEATFTWDFGDGSPRVTTPGAVFQQTHNFLLAGLYEVTLTVESKCFPNPIIRRLKVLVRDQVTPIVKIKSSSDSLVCEGAAVTFRATVTNPGTAPSYQWLVNGVPAGSDNVQFGPVTPGPNDWVKCVVNTALTCSGSTQVADSIQVKIAPVFQPQVTISTPATQVCPGTPVTFTAQTPIPYLNAGFRWLINGIVSGNNSPTFTYTPAHNDRIFCIITLSDECAKPPADTSETIVMTTISAPTPNIIIQAIQNDLCAGSIFTFTANTAFGGPNPGFNWLVNGLSSGVTTPGFSSVLNNGDTVTCLLTSSLSCITVQTVPSSPVVAQVRQPSAPVITIGTPGTDVCENDTVFVNTSVAGSSVVPTLEWYINSSLFATNNSGAVRLTNLQNNDTVSARSIGGVDCLLPSQTNRLVFRVASPTQATVSIQSTVNGVCLGEDIGFTAVQTNGGANPMYNWRVNGLPVVSNGSTLNLSRPTQDVRVQLELISSNTCVAPVLSNLVEVPVFPLPVIQFNQPDTVIRAGTSVTLRPIIQSSAPVAEYAWLPAASLNNSTVLNPEASPAATTLFNLKVTDQNSCSSEGEFEVIVSGKLLMPNAFTPNGDGLNDLFSIPSTIFIDLGKFTVYNRWGQVVFETQNARQGWDGSVKGSPLPSGTYAWFVQYRDAFTGAVESLKGTVMLIR